MEGFLRGPPEPGFCSLFTSGGSEGSEEEEEEEHEPQWERDGSGRVGPAGLMERGLVFTDERRRQDARGRRSL